MNRVYWYKVPSYNMLVSVYDKRRERLVELLKTHGIDSYEYQRDDVGFYLTFTNTAHAVLFRMLWDD